MDCSPPGSPVHGILQASILEWLAIPVSRDPPDPGLEPGSLVLQADSLQSEPPGKPQEYWSGYWWLAKRPGYPCEKLAKYQVRGMGFHCMAAVRIQFLPGKSAILREREFWVYSPPNLTIFSPEMWRDNHHYLLNSWCICSKRVISVVFLMLGRCFPIGWRLCKVVWKAKRRGKKRPLWIKSNSRGKLNYLHHHFICK